MLPRKPGCLQLPHLLRLIRDGRLFNISFAVGGRSGCTPDGRLPVRFLETVPMLATPRTASVARNGWVTSEKRSDHQGCGKCWQGNPPQLVRWEAKDYTSIRRNSGSEGGPLPVRTGENRA